MPSTQVELDHGNEPLNGIVDVGHGKEGLGVRHEAVPRGEKVCSRSALGRLYLVIRSSIERGSRMKVGSTTLLRSAPGRSWEMIWERTGRFYQTWFLS